jgi:GGDEF domain-containing protein
VATLTATAEELAKEWLMILLDEAPLERAPSIAAAGLAREGPQICEAVLRALADDRALKAIEQGGSMEPLIARAGVAAGARDPAAISRGVEALREVVWHAVRRSLLDAHGDDVALLAERLALVIEVVRGAALRDRVRKPDPGWPALLKEHVVHARRGGSAMALVLIELEDADRLIAVESAAEAEVVLAQFESVVRRTARPGDVVVTQPGGRAWVITVEASRPEAAELGSRLSRAVHALGPWRGAPLRATVGVAVLGEDAADAAGLIDVAEERRFEAGARGIEISRGSPKPD